MDDWVSSDQFSEYYFNATFGFLLKFEK